MSKAKIILLVLVGGMFGTFFRWYFAEVGTYDDITAFESLVACNTAGAFLLGFLDSALSKSKTPFATGLNAFFGTGFLGSFTTFSFLAVLIHAMHMEKGILCMALSIALGIAASYIGVLLGGKGRNQSNA